MKCLPDRSTKHLCSKKLERGEVCKDEIHDCDGCKKNGEFIEVVVRCAQGNGIRIHILGPLFHIAFIINFQHKGFGKNRSGNTISGI